MTEPRSRFLGGVLPPSPIDAASDVADGLVYELPPDARGAWRITTSKSTHVIDLDGDQPTYQRLPGRRSKAFDTDGAVHHLTRVELWPRVGWRFVFRFQDPMRPHELERCHATSPVQRIAPIHKPGGAGETEPLQE